MIATIIVYMTVSVIFVIAGYTGYHELFGSVSLDDVNVVNIVEDVMPLPHVQIPMIDNVVVVQPNLVVVNELQENINLKNELVDKLVDYFLSQNKVNMNELRRWNGDVQQQVIGRLVEIIDNNMFNNYKLDIYKEMDPINKYKYLGEYFQEFEQWETEFIEANGDYLLRETNYDLDAMQLKMHNYYVIDRLMHEIIRFK